MSDDNDLYEPSEHDEHHETPAGNRPAQGARQGTPGEVFGESFTGSDTAGDFLGLDVDMEAMYAAGSDEEELGLAGEPLDVRAPEEVWNEEEDEYAADDLDPDSVLEGDPNAYVATPADAWDDEDELAVEELDEEYEDDFDAEDDEAVAVGGGAGRKLALVAVPFVVGVLAVAGVVLVPRMLGSGEANDQVEVARGTAPERPGTTTAEPIDDATDPASTGGDERVTEGELVVLENPTAGSSEGETLAGDPDLGDPLLGELTVPEDAQGEVELAEGEPFPGLDGTDPGTARPGLDELIGNLVEEAGNAPAKQPTNPVEGFPARATLAGGSVWNESSSDQWDVIWQGDAVPMEAISSKQQVLTPRVGGVRVHMQSGEVFDGRLYALGQDRVWIDARPGRVGLDGSRVTKIDRLAPGDAERTTGTQAIKGERVKVRVPGGHLFGHVLADDGEGTLTVLVESGGRVTIAAAEVEAIGSSRVRVLE